MEPYQGGGTNVWKGMALKGSIFAVVGIVAAVVLVGFFTGGAEGLVGEAPAAKEHATPVTPGVVYQPDVEGSSAQPVPPGNAVATRTREVIDPFKDLTPSQRYVAKLEDRGRVRLAARAQVGNETLAQIQWVTPEGVVQESLWLTDLEELGFTITAKSYGFLIEAGKHAIIATAWPMVVPVRETEAKLYSTTEAGGRNAGIASVASESGGANHPAGTTVIPKGSNTSRSFPEVAGYTTK